MFPEPFCVFVVILVVVPVRSADCKFKPDRVNLNQVYCL